MDAKFLSTSLTIPLTKCLAELIECGPVGDPIEWIAHWLYRYKDQELYFCEKSDLMQNMTHVSAKLEKERRLKHRCMGAIRKEICSLKTNATDEQDCMSLMLERRPSLVGRMGAGATLGMMFRELAGRLGGWAQQQSTLGGRERDGDEDGQKSRSRHRDRHRRGDESPSDGRRRWAGDDYGDDDDYGRRRRGDPRSRDGEDYYGDDEYDRRRRGDPRSRDGEDYYDDYDGGDDEDDDDYERRRRGEHRRRVGGYDGDDDDDDDYERRRRGKRGASHRRWGSDSVDARGKYDEDERYYYSDGMAHRDSERPWQRRTEDGRFVDVPPSASGSRGSQERREGGRPERTVTCRWSLDCNLGLVCYHPILGVMRTSCPFSFPKTDTPEWWTTKGFNVQNLYDPELYTVEVEGSDK